MMYKCGQDKGPPAKGQTPLAGQFDRYGGTGAKRNAHRYSNSSHNSAAVSTPHNRSSAHTTDRNRIQKGTNETEKSSNQQTDATRSTTHKDGRDRDQREKDHRAEVQKSAVRVSGDWSEHVSSSGKRYYYNCRSEVSQWERPKDWVEVNAKPVASSDASRQKDGHSSSSSSKNANNDHSRHSASNASSSNAVRSHHADRTGTVHEGGGSIRQRNDTSHQNDFRHRNDSGQWNDSNKAADANQRSDLSCNSSRGNGVQRSRPDNQTNNVAARYDSQLNNGGRVAIADGQARKDNTPLTPGRAQYSRTSDSRHSRKNRRANNDGGSTMAAVNDWRQTQQSEDMQLSAGSTPTEESMYEACSSRMPYTSGQPPVVTTTPSMLTALGALQSPGGAQRSDNQQITQQAIQTLQKLREALIVQQQQQQQRQLQQQQHRQLQQLLQQQIQHQQQQLQLNINAGSKSPESEGTPLQSPDIEHTTSATHRLQEEDWPRDSPISENSVKSSRRDSPPHTDNIAISTSHLAPTRDVAHLTPSLANYYSESLLGHVVGWQGDQAEKQADRLREEAHSLCNEQTTWVSAELKRARSLVRITEIQSTLQEQRVLFIRQQIKDLESLRGPNTFMSTQRDT